MAGGGAGRACAVGPALKSCRRPAAGAVLRRAGRGGPAGRGGATLSSVLLPWPSPAPGAAPSAPGRARGSRTDGPWRRPPPASRCSPPLRSLWRPGLRLAPVPAPVSETPALPSPRLALLPSRVDPGERDAWASVPERGVDAPAPLPGLCPERRLRTFRDSAHCLRERRDA